jgi:hypothetical protein
MVREGDHVGVRLEKLRHCIHAPGRLGGRIFGLDGRLLESPPAAAFSATISSPDPAAELLLGGVGEGEGDDLCGLRETVRISVRIRG